MGLLNWKFPFKSTGLKSLLSQSIDELVWGDSVFESQ